MDYHPSPFCIPLLWPLKLASQTPSSPNQTPSTPFLNPDLNSPDPPFQTRICTSFHTRLSQNVPPTPPHPGLVCTVWILGLLQVAEDLSSNLRMLVGTMVSSALHTHDLTRVDPLGWKVKEFVRGEKGLGSRDLEI